MVDVFDTAVEQNSAGVSNSSSSRRRRAVSSLSYRGVSNPTTCLTHGSHMIWKVSNSDYPKYDKDSLYNTNPSFDDGPFRALEERHQLESTKFELFAYKFDQEGVYVFTSSKNPESVMVSVIPCLCWEMVVSLHLNFHLRSFLALQGGLLSCNHSIGCKSLRSL